MMGKDFAVKNAWRNTLTTEIKRKKKDELEESIKETKLALKILKETIELNDPPCLKSWLAAFHVMIAASFSMMNMTYKDYCDHMEHCKQESKHMWE